MPDTRWASFTDDELWEIWVGLTVDDRIQYSVSEDDRPTYALCVEIHAEAERRGMITDRNRNQWENVV